jgi:hypothetical protein
MERRRFLVTSLVTLLAGPPAAVGEQASVGKIGLISMVPRTPILIAPRQLTADGASTPSAVCRPYGSTSG